MRKILTFLLLFTFFASFSQSIFAQGESQGDATQAIGVAYEKVNPKDRGSYVVKRLKEKAMLALLSFSKPKKADYYNKLVSNRLAELKYVVDKKDMANFEHATTRYFTTVGQFADFLTKNGTEEQKSQVAKNLSLHIAVLEGLRGTFEGQEKAEWRFMQDDINYVRMYTDQLQK